ASAADSSASAASSSASAADSSASAASSSASAADSSASSAESSATAAKDVADKVLGSDDGDPTTTQYGDGAKATGKNSSAFGHNAIANADNSTAIGANAQATAPNSVALGANSVANEANTVSVGSAGHERRITNVADGVNPTDAVNKRQLDKVSSDLHRTDRKLRAGIAGAVAVANIPQVTKPGGSVVGLGVGNYNGQSAVAVGYSRASESNKVIIKMSAGATTQGDYNVGAGIGYQW
ncbi:YadA family autotransporter adhesin, partial [Lonepinella sp. BR2357]|uniref:YadA family autotransporter adhesin n=1 Tax=Lonepinella sp. BR2357 TaxID=3434549 RepID=UPI003F6E27DA